MIARVNRFLRCVQDIPRAQLVRRLQLQLCRRWMSSPLGIPFRSLGDSVVGVREKLLESRFEQRSQLVGQTARGFVLRQLGEEYLLEPPIDWLCVEKPGTRHLDRLTLHYHEYLESLPFEKGHEIILDWIEQNPPWRKGYWLDSWNGYAISLRCVCWFQWIAKYRTRLTEQALEPICRSLSQQLTFLTKNLETDICGNHLLKNIRCLLWSAACCEGSDAKNWGERGWQLLVEQFPIQFPGDGLHYELSPAYHCQGFADMLDCLSALEGDRRSWLEERLYRIAQCTCDLTHPDGLISLFSDGGMQMVYSPIECLRVFAELTEKRITSRPQFVMEPSGYAGIRLGNDFLLLDAGPTCEPSLPAHGHGDMLSFEWDLAGKRFVVDPGVFEYEQGSRRHASRSSITHNTVTVGNWDQCEFIGSFRTGWKNHAHCTPWKTLDSTTFEISASYYHSQANYTHERRLQVQERSLRVVDRIQGAPYPIAKAGILLSHEATVLDRKPNQVLISFHGMTLQLSSESKVTVESATWSSDFGVAHPTNRILIEYGPVPGEFGFQFQQVN